LWVGKITIMLQREGPDKTRLMNWSREAHRGDGGGGSR